MNLHWEKIFSIFKPLINSLEEMEKKKSCFIKAKVDEFL